MLAGIAVGVFRDPSDAVAHCVRPQDTVTPQAENTAAYSKLFDTYRQIHDALAPIYRER